MTVMLRRRRRNGRGVKHERCVELLEALGIERVVVLGAEGYWRNKRADVMLWEFSGTFQGITVTGGCWESMTKCAQAKRLIWDRKADLVWPEVN